MNITYYKVKLVDKR